MMQPMHGTLAHAAAPKRGKSAVLRSLEELSSEMQTEGAVLIMPEEEVFFSPTRTHFDLMSHTHSFYLSPALFRGGVFLSLTHFPHMSHPIFPISRRHFFSSFSLTRPFSPYVTPNSSYMHHFFFSPRTLKVLPPPTTTSPPPKRPSSSSTTARWRRCCRGRLNRSVFPPPPRNPPYPPPPLPPRTPP